MAGYRAYIVGHDGHFKRSEEFEAADDASAVRRAEDFAAADPVELWEGARRIGVIASRGEVVAAK
ncbi:MAG: hypothetical protein KIT85_06580 [Pseudolabrys sp.]|nr:hypothetical protein [Pseudolabrys sp.]MCW5684045.1 hypothetical protein [Pseudolabrys sp.]